MKKLSSKKIDLTEAHNIIGYGCSTTWTSSSGTGKDTYLQRNHQDHPVVSLDDIRRTHKIAPNNTKANGKVLQLAKEVMKSYLRKRQPFVFNATNIIQQLRKQWIDLFACRKNI